MTHLNQRCDFALKFLSKIVFTCILPCVEELQFLYCYIVLLVDRLEDISARTGTNLLLKLDIMKVNAEIILCLLELLTQDVARLLGLCLWHKRLLLLLLHLLYCGRYTTL